MINPKRSMKSDMLLSSPIPSYRLKVEHMNCDNTFQKAKRVLREAREQRSRSSITRISLRNISRRHSPKASRYSPVFSKAETSIERLHPESYPPLRNISPFDAASRSSSQEEEPKTEVRKENRDNGLSEPRINRKMSKLDVADSEVAEIMDELKKHDCFNTSKYKSSVQSNDQKTLTDSIIDFLDKYDNTMRKCRRRRKSILSSKYKEDEMAKVKDSSLSKYAKSRTRNVRFNLNVECHQLGEDDLQSYNEGRKANWKQKEVKGILRNSRIYSVSCQNKRIRGTTMRNSLR
ncbi:predicted protein [Chaetoceros tenuissimus]|uniref:Uncharacterized protein n=1 Tax=Chaetoceros tenuissimus TaxID=426638 RepID=A0AAD3CJ43_9STRA|nr:predicted protein [Chaetoceros tenuissimus]